MMRRYQQRKRFRTSIPEVSLTPLIDTALTLLIIFMVTTPMLHNALKIELPKGASQEASKESEQLIVSIDTNGAIFFNNQQVTLDNLGDSIKTYLTKSSYNNQEQSIWVYAHAKSHCELLVGVIDRIKIIGGIKDVNVAMQKMAPNRA